MSVGHGPPFRAASITEVDISTETVLFTSKSPGWKRVSMQIIVAGYTKVKVRLNGSLDGVTFSEIKGMAVKKSGDIKIEDIGPLAKIRISAEGNLSGGTDTLDVWLGVEFAPR